MQGHSGEDLAGADISKAWIDVCLSGSRPVERVANTPEALAAWIARARPALVGMEPTGGERPLCSAVAEAGVRYGKLHPNTILAFRKAQGLRAKTDLNRVKTDAVAVDISTDHFDAHRLKRRPEPTLQTTPGAAMGRSSKGWPRPRWTGSSSSRPAPITAPSNARGGRSPRQGRSPSSAPRQARPVKRAASPRRPARWRRPIVSTLSMRARMGALLELQTRPPRSRAWLELQGAGSRLPNLAASLGERPHRR